jgi:pyruvate/2-oxoglutarate/acetoin dehydrogenase E1 component
LSSQVEALTQKKKEKENVMIDMELINLKNVSMLNFEEIRRRITKAKILKIGREK